MKDLTMARVRAALVQEVRSFFVSRSYLEVDTPALAPALIPEPHIEVFATRYRHPHGDAGETPGVASNPGVTQNPGARYLVPSPEIWMKELLTAGYGDIFQLSHCFRNAESVGQHHSPEFTMLEWYTVDADYRQSADLTDDLLEHLAGRLTGGAANPGAWLSPEQVAACRPPAERMSVEEAFVRLAGAREGVLDNVERMRTFAEEAGLAVRLEGPDADSEDDLFQRLFLTLVEDRLPTDHPVILTDYPSRVPTLAREGNRPGYAERWELYLRGIEIANCYTEEHDAGRLADYLRRSAAAKHEALEPHATANGLVEFSAAPPCSGVALGVDRLLMALTGARDIREVIFPTSFCIFRSHDRGRGLEW